MKVALDTSSILWKALFAGKDEDGYEEVDSEGKARWINTAAYGLQNAANSLRSTMNELGFNPKDIIVVLDGANGTQLRKQIYPEYKGTRQKSKAQYTEYNELEKTFVENMLSLGAQVATHEGVEADDLIGWLAENIVEDQLLIWTGDNDLVVLAKHPHVGVYIGGKLNPKPYGEFPYEYIDVYKATVGDSSDNIKGAKGFGPKAFEKLYALFGDNGLSVLRKLIIGKALVKLQEDVPQLPALQKLIDYSRDVEISLKCAKLHTEMVHPEQIEWQHGLNKPYSVVHPYLLDWAQRVVGVTASNFLRVFAEIKRLAKENPLVSLDIETSTPEDSDDWVAKIKGEEGKMVDVYGSELVSVQMTLGGNFQHTFDFSINHADTENVSADMVEQVLMFLNPTHRFIIHNTNFELPVLHNAFGWFLRDVDDTKLMASYVDENDSLALKKNTKRWLGYDQTSYEETVTDAETGRLRKMDELTLKEALAYGADDTICTAALYQWFQLHMMLEQVWEVYRKVEIGAAFWTAQAFLDGFTIDQVALAKMIKRDATEKQDQEGKLDEYLIQQGWDGTRLAEATTENFKEPAFIKYAYEIVTGAPLKTAKRKFEGLMQEVRVSGLPTADTLASIFESGDVTAINDYLKAFFNGRPQFNSGSPKQLQRLLYDVMKLPIRVRNKPTDLMRKNGVDGSPKTDELAISSALHYDLPTKDERREALNALLQIKTLQTRQNLYYKTYPYLPHWKDREPVIHASLNQCATNTRRFTSSNPNLQQLSKGKGDFRKIFVPHCTNAMVVSLDFSAQELRLIADYSKDPNMLACYMGAVKKDMHALTAAGIAGMPYSDFKTILDDENHPKHKWAKDIRKLAKTVNFASEYGAMADKMAETLMVSSEDAQAYLEAKWSTFNVSEDWKKSMVSLAKDRGYSLSKLGARRHLTNINSSNKWEAAKDERRAVNFMIQGSGAEMTKLALGRIWDSQMRNKYDMRFLAMIHDEAVFSIAIEDMPKVIPEIYACMTAQYADMEVPIQSSVSAGLNFGDQHELGDEVVPTAENIQALIAKILGEHQAAA